MLKLIGAKIYDIQARNLLGKQFVVIRRNCSNLKQDNYLGVSYDPDFSEDQKTFLLEVLNKSSPDELLRFNLSLNRVKKIDAWKQKNGEFKNLTEVLDVDGLGVKMLHRLCMTIIEAGSDSKNNSKEKPLKTRGQILVPTLSTAKINDLQSALGINLFSSGLSWARIEKTNNYLTNWNYVNYNTVGKKLTLTDTLQIVLNVCEELPSSDVYVFEAPVSVTPTAQQSPISVSAYAQRVQLLSMLMTVLSTSPQHNPLYIKLQSVENEQKYILQNFEPNVFFLRYRLPARLFRTVVGTERVSAATTINSIIKKEKAEKSVSYSPVTIDTELSSMYEAELPVNKEVLGQALLLSMAFMDVCVYQNIKSIRTIKSSRS